MLPRSSTSPSASSRHLARLTKIANWLDAYAVAALMGVGREAVRVRARRGKLPSELHDGRRWFRRDHPELVKQADRVRRGCWLGGSEQVPTSSSHRSEDVAPSSHADQSLGES